MIFPTTLGHLTRRCPRWIGLFLALSVLPGVWGQESLTVEETATLAPMPTPVVAAGNSFTYTPLTRHERWHGYLHETFLGTRPALQIFGTAFLDHLGHAPVQWGVGLHGYTHRLENRFFSTMIDGSVHSAMAALLRQDTRYLPAPDRRAAHRVGHALGRTFFTYSQTGERVFDISGLSGIYAGTMLPMFWHPRGYSPLHQGVQEGNFGVMFQAGNNLFKEFRPDIVRLFVKK
jgi:hypothetical protein